MESKNLKMNKERDFHIPTESRILKSIYWCGQNSWYLFLSQMTVLCFFGIGHLSFIGNTFVRECVFVSTIVVLCILWL